MLMSGIKDLLILLKQWIVGEPWDNESEMAYDNPVVVGCDRFIRWLDKDDKEKSSRICSGSNTI